MPVDVEAMVLSNDRLSADYNVLRIAAPDVAASTRPGQFVMIKQGLDTEPLLRRPFSIFEVVRASDGAVEGLSLLNKAVGTVTRSLFAAEPGGRLRCLGPLGTPFTPVTAPAEGWMVAGGVGLAPFLTLAETLRARGVATTLFYGARSAAELYYVDRFESLGVRVVLTTEDGSRGDAGLVTSPLQAALERATRETDLMIYACGPTGMMRAVAALADQHGRVCEVSLEPVMGCGLGGCYSCVVPLLDPAGAPRFTRSCLEGPVFRGDRLVWNGLT